MEIMVWQPIYHVKPICKIAKITSFVLVPVFMYFIAFDGITYGQSQTLASKRVSLFLLVVTWSITDRPVATG